MDRIDMEESPYCEVCGHCGEIACCGIRGFIEAHIKGKTNCKNEEGIVQDLISICEYETEVFKKNDTLNKGIDELLEKYEHDNEILKQTIFTYDRFDRFDNFTCSNYSKEEAILRNKIYEEIIQDLEKLKGE